MRYSSDLRKRVLDFLQTGGSKAEASRRFSVSRPTIYKWVEAPDPFAYQKPGPRAPRALDPNALKEHADAFPDATLKERACHFGVSTFCISYHLKRIGYTRKKKHSDIRSNVRRNVVPIVSNSKRSSKKANPEFTPMRAGSETKVIDVMGMREKVKPSLGSSQVNALGR